METFQIRPGDVLAYYRARGKKRELSVQEVRIQESNNRWINDPGSVGSEWVPVGYEYCSRPEGSRYWFSDAGPRFSSVREAVIHLAENFEIPDDALVHPHLIRMRADLSLTAEERAAKAQREAEDVSGSAAEPPSAPAEDP